MYSWNCFDSISYTIFTWQLTNENAAENSCIAEEFAHTSDFANENIENTYFLRRTEYDSYEQKMIETM